MKTNYEERALKFAKTILVDLFKGCQKLEDFENAVWKYNITHRRQLITAYGVSRIVVIRADYVIKFDIKPTGHWRDGRAGNCKSELKIYEKACREGFDYLLAKPSVYTINSRTFSIMPRINGVGNEDKWYIKYLTKEEADWLRRNVNDLHENNLGYYKGKPVIIDYAFERK